MLLFFQIIGWIGCAYLVVKAFDLLSRERNGLTDFTAALSLFAGVGFAIWLFVVGERITTNVNAAARSISASFSSPAEPIVTQPETATVSNAEMDAALANAIAAEDAANAVEARR